jgi:outer membrane protein with beta-barrel domain
MRHITGIALAAALLLFAPSSAQAQAPEDHLHFSFGGGFTSPNSDVRDRLGNGYNILFTVQYDLTRFVGIEGFLSTNSLGDTQLSIPVSAAPFASPIPREFGANMTIQLATANLVVAKPAGAIRPYGLAGMGVYDRPVEITTNTIGWVSGYCDPWLYVCVGGEFTEVQEVIGRRSSTDFGVNLGGGANFGYFFTELRYHYIWGPTIEPRQVDSAAPIVTRKINGRFVAISFGVRF